MKKKEKNVKKAKFLKIVFFAVGTLAVLFFLLPYFLQMGFEKTGGELQKIKRESEQMKEDITRLELESCCTLCRSSPPGQELSGDIPCSQVLDVWRGSAYNIYEESTLDSCLQVLAQETMDGCQQKVES